MKIKFQRRRGLLERLWLYDFLCAVFGCRWDHRIWTPTIETSFFCPRCERRQPGNVDGAPPEGETVKLQ